MDKFKEYLQRSFPISHRQIVYILSVFASDSSLKSSPVDYGYSKIKINSQYFKYLLIEVSLDKRKTTLSG